MLWGVRYIVKTIRGESITENQKAELRDLLRMLNDQLAEHQKI